MHFIRIPHRHAAVSPYLTSRRVWQQMVNGAWLDFYCIGPLQRQEDRTGLDEVGDLYRFHSAHETYFVSSRPAGQIGVVRRTEDEYMGIVQILSENHIAYELCTLQPASLRTFSLVIVPDAGSLDADETKSLDDYVHQGGKIILTNRVPETLECLGPLKLVASRDYPQGAYIRLRPEDKRALTTSALPLSQNDPQAAEDLPSEVGSPASSAGQPSAEQPILNKLDLVYLRGAFHEYEFDPPTEGLLRLIPPGMFGPPEKCYYTKVSDRPALLHRKYGRGQAACFTFGVGKHYNDQAHAGHAALLTGTIDNVLRSSRRLIVTTSPLVEINHRRDVDGRFEWVSLYNHTGHRGNAFHEPIPIQSVTIDLLPTASLRSVRSLFAGQDLPVHSTDTERVQVVLPELGQYDVVVFEY